MSHRLAPVLLLLLAGCSAAVADPAPVVEAKPNDSKPPPPAPSSIDLGTLAAGTELSFDVPENTLGFAIVAQAQAGRGDAIGVAELHDPNGVAVVPDFASVRGVAVGTGVNTFVYPPIGDVAPMKAPAGRWKVKFGGESYDAKNPKGATGRPWSGDVHGIVQLQTSATSTFETGVLDIDIYVPPGLTVAGGAPLDVSSAPNDASLRDRIDKVFALESRLYGIERGEVRFHPIDASVLTLSSYAALDTANELATARGERPSAQLVLTNKLEPDGEGEGESSGIANCLPGAVGIPGTKCSAVIVALRSSPEDDATTIVHELGHFIGLEHTSELDGRYFDELSDTPKCESSAKSALASCPDFGNLMFPTSIVHQERTIVVSPTQARVMRASPIYRSVRR